MVAADERELGRRKELNLGHTFAHAIEHAAGYGRIPHGVAVAAGLGLALAASEALGLLEDPDLPGRRRPSPAASGCPRPWPPCGTDRAWPWTGRPSRAPSGTTRRPATPARASSCPGAWGRSRLDVAVQESLLASLLASR